MPERINTDIGEQPQREGIVTIDDMLLKSHELYEGLKRLCDTKYPLDIRRGSSVRGKGVEDLDMGDEASRIVKAGSITYFFDVKETKDNKPYLLITESRFKGEGEERERKTIAVFQEHAQAFLEAVQEMAGKLT